jgi:hypothetical protein
VAHELRDTDREEWSAIITEQEAIYQRFSGIAIMNRDANIITSPGYIHPLENLAEKQLYSASVSRKKSIYIYHTYQ